MSTVSQAAAWLPPGKAAAVCFSVDDIHPGTSQDAYEAGGDLSAGALGRLVQLQRRHPQLKATLCVTPDWRLRSLVPDTRLWRRIPGVRNRVHWTRLHRPGRFRIDRHPRLVSFLNGLERCEIVLHGLHHAAPGARFATEFQNQSTAACVRAIEQGLALFDAAKLRYVRGYVPPAWNAPMNLLRALEQRGFAFLCSARDVQTAVAPDAKACMSGLPGVSLIHPELIEDLNIVHLTSNFQATSCFDRAVEIVEHGGLLHVKAHIFKTGGGHTMLDGLDELYCNYLDIVFSELQRRYGARLWWAHLSEVAARLRRGS